jgi:hypothetical protein
VMVDVFRAVTLLLVGSCMVAVPYAVGLHLRPRRTLWLLSGYEILVVGYVARIIDHWGDKVKWYGSPAAFIGGLLLMVYVLITISDYRKEQK